MPKTSYDELEEELEVALDKLDAALETAKMGQSLMNVLIDLIRTAATSGVYVLDVDRLIDSCQKVDEGLGQQLERYSRHNMEMAKYNERYPYAYTSLQQQTWSTAPGNFVLPHINLSV